MNQLNELPVLIDGPGRYMTRNGRVAEVYTVKPVAPEGSGFTAHGKLLADGARREQFQLWHVSGRRDAVAPGKTDLVSKLPDASA